VLAPFCIDAKPAPDPDIQLMMQKVGEHNDPLKDSRRGL
jgi:hypothetical protein